MNINSISNTNISDASISGSMESRLSSKIDSSLLNTSEIKSQKSDINGKQSTNNGKPIAQVDNKKLDKNLLKNMVEDINSYLDSNEIHFSYNDNVDQMVVNIVNKKNGDIISKIPPEYIIKMMENYKKNEGKIEGTLLNHIA